MQNQLVLFFGQIMFHNIAVREDIKMEEKKPIIRTTATVNGMMCSTCEKNVIKAVENNFGVKSVSASHEQQLIEIVSEGPIDEAKLDDVISAQGYILGKVEAEEM